jgi:hypothetical protein
MAELGTGNIGPLRRALREATPWTGPLPLLVRGQFVSAWTGKDAWSQNDR